MSVFGSRKVRFSDLSAARSVTKTVTIPIGGGAAFVNFFLSDFGFSTEIDAIIHVNVSQIAPITNNVYAPSWGINTNSTALGVTVSAGSGITLGVSVLALGI
jgi:hypothetical protein